MTTTTFADPTDDGPDLDTLLDQARRHQENWEGLLKHQAYLQAEMARHEAELVIANYHLASLPTEHAAGPVFEAKTAVIAIELNRDLLVEQLYGLQDELTATPKLIAANKKAIAAAKAEQ